jgi:hypothetical protein
MTQNTKASRSWRPSGIRETYNSSAAWRASHRTVLKSTSFWQRLSFRLSGSLRPEEKQIVLPLIAPERVLYRAEALQWQGPRRHRTLGPSQPPQAGGARKGSRSPFGSPMNMGRIEPVFIRARANTKRTQVGFGKWLGAQRRRDNIFSPAR